MNWLTRTGSWTMNEALAKPFRTKTAAQGAVLDYRHMMGSLLHVVKEIPGETNKAS